MNQTCINCPGAMMGDCATCGANNDDDRDAYERGEIDPPDEDDGEDEGNGVEDDGEED